MLEIVAAYDADAEKPVELTHRAELEAVFETRFEVLVSMESAGMN